jgi:antitoxin YefM
MLTGIREKTVVKENGMVEISAPDLPVRTEVEVIVLVEEEEMDTTEYLLSTEANRKHLEEALEQLKHPENFIRFDMDEFEKLCEK